MEQHSIAWRGIAMTVTFTRDWLGLDDRIEIQTQGNVPLPVTETGYRLNLTPSGTVESCGGAVAFVTLWLDHEAQRTGWSGAQLSLF